MRTFQRDNRLPTRGTGRTASANSVMLGFDRPLVLYFAAILPFAFDYKSERAGAGSLFQGSLLLLHMVLSIAFYSSSSKRRTSAQSPLLAVAVIWFCFIGTCAGYLNGQQIYPMLVNIIPLGLFCGSAYLTVRAIGSVGDISALDRALKLLCLIYLVARFAIVTSSSGLEISTVRYQILSGSANAALGLVSTSLLFGTTLLDAVLLVITFALVILSVTRTQLLIVAADFSVFLRTPYLLFGRSRIFFRSVLVLFPMFAMLLLDQYMSTGIAERWIGRLFVSSEYGVDPTLLTRRAEVEFMINAFGDSGESILFGNGMAAETSRVGQSAAIAAQIVGRASIDEIHGIGFGHHNYWSLLFIGGILGGGPLLAIVFGHCAFAINFLKACSKSPSVDRPTIKLGSWGATIVVGMVTYGFLAGTFGDRTTSIWYGIGSGLLLGAYSRLKRN